MKKNIRRTVQTVLHRKEGPIEAEDFFLPSQPFGDPFKVRTEIEENLQRGTPIIVCLFCKQPVKISGGGDHGKILHFKHLNGSEDCGQKAKNNYTKDEIRCIKYNGAKESERHYKLKHAIADYLTLTPNVQNVAVEKVVKNKAIPRKWRKPDISAEFKEIKLVLELQISTTFLSVIVARNIFYRERGIFIIWIFDNFSISNDLQKFTQKDIFHNNAFNVYVFDEEAQDKSNESQQLILKCFLKKQYLSEKGNRIEEEWNSIFISLDDLNYTSSNYQVVYHDADKEKNYLENLAKHLRQKAATQFKYNREQEEREWKLEREMDMAYYDNDYKVDAWELEEQKKIAEEIKIHLQEFYKNDNYLHYKIQRAIDELSQDGKRYLNEILDFKDIQNKPFLNALIHSRKHDSFALFLFRCEDINLEFSRLNDNGISLLQEILSRKEKFASQGFFIQILFERGYFLTKPDKEFLKSEYKKGNKHNKQLILKISFFSQVSSNKNYIDQITKVRKVLFDILSGKRKKVIGSNSANLLALANVSIEHRPEFWDSVEFAFKEYGTLEIIKKLDKKGNFEKKRQKYLSNKPAPNSEYLPLFSILFPEIFK